MATEALGGVDILVTNAGGPPPGNFASTDVDAYPAAIDLNLLSVVGMCKAAVPAMQAAGWGRVVAITSLAVRQPMPNLILSNTARAGATAFLKTLAREVAEDGRHRQLGAARPAPDGPRARRSTATVAGDARMGDADDFGAIVAFLCSEQAKFLTGAQIHVDGGAYQALQ